MVVNKHEQIISVAQELINEKKSLDISLTMVGQRLGITHGALYRHFKNKDDLWLAVSKDWYNTNIINKITIADGEPQQVLHDWLWAFANAKKRTYIDNPMMFTLNTTYIDSNPKVLKEVLTDSMKWISKLMNYSDDLLKAEAILSTFSTFTLPMFRTTWQDDDYQEKFEIVWELIEPGL